MVQIDILTYNNIILGMFVLFISCLLMAVISNFSLTFLHSASKTTLSSITCIDFKNAAGLVIMFNDKNEFNFFLNRFHAFKNRWFFSTNHKVIGILYFFFGAFYGVISSYLLFIMGAVSNFTTILIEPTKLSVFKETMKLPFFLKKNYLTANLKL